MFFGEGGGWLKRCQMKTKFFQCTRHVGPENGVFQVGNSHLQTFQPIVKGILATPPQSYPPPPRNKGLIRPY